MKKLITIGLILAVAVLTLNSCSRKVVRINTNDQVDISGRWNDTDSRLASEELTDEILRGNWLTDFVQENGKKPIIIVGLVRNKTHEHIDAETFTKEIEKAFIKRQNARIVSGGKMREELRAERADQQENASLSTVKKFGLEAGADFMLQGNINSIVDALGRQKVVYYQIDLELTNIQTNEKVWIGDKKIKKYIKN
ncbi:penicillin-binding protein activator LpoB [Polaribacter batillariae]|uniref:Penicillin-binding protein activator LpoB n=1 Tax=Polaribacter batillariae TaxID=2808900 RepID=A0ABX7SRC2_9FLAO|nr:penicillin-binding protein activator LpoB [Polaribacter batillariae]QTD36790.1 penicillin-binding protein activator LpoB [Polaribacter batillariae]